MDYEATAQRHWRVFRPTAYAALPDPAGFFADLGERAAEAVDLLVREILDSEPYERDPERRARQILRARREAEEHVLPDEVFAPPETGRENHDPSSDDAPLAPHYVRAPVRAHEDSPESDDDPWEGILLG